MIGYLTLGTNDLECAVALYDAPLPELGGADEGTAGPRDFYAGYFRDLDGNKLDACHFAAG